MRPVLHTSGLDSFLGHAKAANVAGAVSRGFGRVQGQSFVTYTGAHVHIQGADGDTR